MVHLKRFVLKDSKYQQCKQNKTLLLKVVLEGWAVIVTAQPSGTTLLLLMFWKNNFWINLFLWLDLKVSYIVLYTYETQF